LRKTSGRGYDGMSELKYQGKVPEILELHRQGKMGRR